MRISIAPDERECITFDAPSLLMATVSSHPVFGIHLVDPNAVPFILAEAFAKIKGDISFGERENTFFWKLTENETSFDL